jgi:hypothetical protein
LKEDFLKGITVVEVLSAPFRPKVVEDETPENIERLASVRVASDIVRKEAWGVVVKFHSGFAEERKRLIDLKVTVSFPFAPYALEGLPSLLCHGAVEKTMLRGLLSARIADFATRGIPMSCSQDPTGSL